MAQVPPPPPPYWPSPRRAPGWQSSPNLVAVLVVVVFFFIIGLIFIPAFAMVGGIGTPFDFFPFCGIFVFVIVLIVVLAAAGMGGYRSTIPPPPPIQQPMVPAGLQGPVALNCPNCGAPPQGVDRFGVATCPYCNTRYLVR